jgi:predicted membrane protein
MHGQLIGGSLIILLGVIFLLDNLNIIESRQILRLWPLLLVFAGLKNVFETTDRAGAVRGTLVASAGALLLLNSLDIISFRFWQLWPLLLIVFGFQMLMRALPAPANPSPNDATDSAQYVSSSAFLAGVHSQNASTAFRGGSINVFMGGVELDLRKAAMESKEAVINVLAMMGGAEIRVPETWSVESRVTPLLGGVEDKTTPPTTPEKHLILDGTILMGGLTVKN